MKTAEAAATVATKEHKFSRKTFNIFIEWIVETQNHEYLASYAMLIRTEDVDVSE